MYNNYRTIIQETFLFDPNQRLYYLKITLNHFGNHFGKFLILRLMFSIILNNVTNFKLIEPADLYIMGK